MTELSSMDSSMHDPDKWFILGKEVPKQEIVYLSQVIILYIVILTCIINLSIDSTNQLWSSLLATALGILLPNPSIKSGRKHIISSGDVIDGRMVSPHASRI